MEQNVGTLVEQYIAQQKELGYPTEYIYSSTIESSPESQEKIEPTIINVAPTSPALPQKTQAGEALANHSEETVLQQVEPTVATAIQEKPAELTFEEKRAKLKEIYLAVHNCHKCQISQSRTKAVFGSGNANADVMVIGEAPGYNEDLQGLPFVGAAGQLLTKMLAAIGLDRNQDVFIANTLKCRPPQNRTPSTEEALNCTPYLQEQIKVINPKAFLLVGKTAASGLLGLTETMGQMRKRTYEYMGKPVIITYHPAALLRNPDLKRESWEDLQRFQAILRETNARATESK